ncbi:hypothetical protein FQA39_LY03980 [Lamprigera yunnana]|nr:hypothetical protein FQA39_LY03980 [Lamprigera yunnana]
MDKKRYYFNNTANIEELGHLAYEEMDENFNDSYDSKAKDHIETRTIDSDTDHDVGEEDECEEDKEAGYYIDKSWWIKIVHNEEKQHGKQLRREHIMC